MITTIKVGKKTFSLGQDYYSGGIETAHQIESITEFYQKGPTVYYPWYRIVFTNGMITDINSLHVTAVISEEGEE